MQRSASALRLLNLPIKSDVRFIIASPTRSRGSTISKVQMGVLATAVVPHAPTGISMLAAGAFSARCDNEPSPVVACSSRRAQPIDVTSQQYPGLLPMERGIAAWLNVIAAA